MNGAQPTDGGPAFPYAFHLPELVGEPAGVNLGMTLRDYFAGQALAARGAMIEPGVRYPCTIAEECYELADAMLAERGKKGGAA
jgi:hypothetical protein